MSLPINDKIIDLFFDSAAAGTFRILQAEKTEIISFNLRLSYGDISKIEDRKEEALKATRFLDGEVKARASKSPYIKEVIKTLNNTKKKIRIWAGKRSSDDLCGLYYLCHELIDNDNLYLVDIPIREDVHLWSTEVDCYMCNDSIPRLHHSSGTKEQMGYNDNFYNNIIYNKISKIDREKYARKWEKLVSINSDIRLYEDGEIRCYKYSDFYDDILSYNNGKPKVAIDYVFEYIHKHNNKQLSFVQGEMIVYRMIKESYVKVVGTEKRHPGREVDALIIQKNE